MAVQRRQGQSRWYTDVEVMEPAFRIEAGVTDEGLEYRDLFMQTFVRDASDPRRWQSQPEPDWHWLARVFQKQIVTYPVFSNPHAQRYLKPRHGRFRTLTYEKYFGKSLPDNPASAISDIELSLPWRTFNPCNYGLGLTKELDEIWRGLSSFPQLNTIVLGRDDILRVDGNTVRIPEDELQAIRRAFERTTRKMRDVVKQARTVHIRNTLLAPLDSERFPPIVQVNPEGQLVEVRLDRGRQSKEVARAGRKATVKALRSNVEKLATEAPRELIELHAEIERVTLAQMIEQYESMLQKGLSENVWQKFFERNIFILTMIFARPVRLLHTQFHAQGSRLDGTGAQIGDYLFAEQGLALAIVEIKKPSSSLLRAKPYRNKEVFAPDEELSGAVTQVLYQQSKLHENWLIHQQRPELRDSRPDAWSSPAFCPRRTCNAGVSRCFEMPARTWK